jgi:hypothetical protein
MQEEEEQKTRSQSTFKEKEDLETTYEECCGSTNGVTMEW